MKELKINTDFIKTAEVLGDAELGRLFRGMLQYASSGAEPQLNGNERIAWPAVKVDIDRQEGQYRNKVNGAAKARAVKILDIKGNQDDIRLIDVDIKRNQDSRKEEGEKEAPPPKEAPREKVSPQTPFLKENPPENPPPEERGEGEKTQSARVREAFEAFWKAYPKKVGKKDAFKAYQKLTAEERAQLVQAVEIQKQSRQWQAEGGRFIPNPSTWLNQGRWMDEGIDPTMKTRGGGKTAQELYDFYDMLNNIVREEEAKNNDAD